MAIERRVRRADGSLGDFEKVMSGETKEEKIERLESNNAELMYDSMLKDAELHELKNSHAEMLYNLMMNGVI